MRDTKISNRERFRSSPMNFGLIIFSPRALMTINPITITSAFVIPDSARARKAGGMTLRVNPILGIKLNKKGKKAQRNGFGNAFHH
jgi:hypothetical protein